MKIQFKDRLPITSTRERTPEGYLKATTALTCVGVQEYTDRQMGGTTDEIVGVFRPPETVFHKETIHTAKLKPITDNHPDIDVDAANYRNLSVGTLGDTIEPLDEQRLGGSCVITDERMIEGIDAGKLETSLGYEATIKQVDGEWNGKAYKYAFVGPMMINHLAIVERGRCGPNVKILDKEDTIMDIETLIRNLKDAGVLDSDGKVIQKAQPDVAKVITDGFKPVLEKLPSMISDEIKKQLADKQVEDEKEEETDEQRAQAITDAANKRAKLIVDTAPLCNGEDMTDKSEREIMLKAIGDSVENADKLSDAQLEGVLMTIQKDRKAADEQKFETTAFSDEGMGNKPLNFSEIRRAAKKG